jgi:hypothetical protein
MCATSSESSAPDQDNVTAVIVLVPDWDSRFEWRVILRRHGGREQNIL